jgi:SAM-dependent methyltransferase
MTGDRRFTVEPLRAVIDHLQQRTPCTIEIVDPDLERGRYAGEVVEHAGLRYVHRPFRTWVDLAERAGLRLLTPERGEAPFIQLRFERLDRAARLQMVADDPREKYGTGSEFARISKLEDPNLVLDLSDALARVGTRARVLDLGVNTGDELALITATEIIGVDHSTTALAVARERFPSARFIEGDLNALPALGLGRFDLVISLGTLQSPGIDDREVVRRIVQDHLAPDGAVILGFPNARYIDGELEHGTRMVNYRQPELGALIKDVAFYRKYLQQHGRRVFVTGKYELLITAI